MRKEIEKAGVKDPQVLDKSYWIQRVGEVRIDIRLTHCIIITLSVLRVLVGQELLEDTRVDVF
jgi:hypothetical protein